MKENLDDYIKYYREYGNHKTEKDIIESHIFTELHIKYNLPKEILFNDIVYKTIMNYISKINTLPVSDDIKILAGDIIKNLIFNQDIWNKQQQQLIEDLTIYNDRLSYQMRLRGSEKK
jgi:hypothetical protein